MQKILIFQTSPNHTASTVLVNLLYGLINPLRDKKIRADWDDETEWQALLNTTNILVLKSHHTNIDELIAKYQHLNCRLFFIASERYAKGIFFEDQKYKRYRNCLFFDFHELNETASWTLENIVDKVLQKLRNHPLLQSLVLSKEDAMARLTKMNQRYNLLQHFPYEFIDEFYELHGSHRDRCKGFMMPGDTEATKRKVVIINDDYFKNEYLKRQQTPLIARQNNMFAVMKSSSSSSSSLWNVVTSRYKKKVSTSASSNSYAFLPKS